MRDRTLAIQKIYHYRFSKYTYVFNRNISFVQLIKYIFSTSILRKFKDKFLKLIFQSILYKLFSIHVITYICLKVFFAMEPIKSKLDNFLDDLSNEFRGVIRIEHFITNHYVIGSKSFRDYATGQSISNGRRFRMCLNMILMIFNIARYIVLSIYDDEWILILTGEFCYKLYDMKIIAKFIVAGLALGLSFQSVTYWVEYKHRFKIIEVFYQLQHYDHQYKLTKINTRKFNIFSYGLYKLFLVQTYYWLGGATIALSLLLVYQAYLDDQIDHYLLLLILNMINLSLWVRQAFISSFSTIALFYLTIYYARLKFNEFLAFLRNNVNKGNNQGIIKIIIFHKQLRELIIDLSGHINMVIGCAYNIYPYMIVISLHIAWESEITRTRIFMTTICLVLFLLNYIMNMVSSWFPQKNIDIPKCLYRLSCNNSVTGMRLKLKMDEFILSLNENYVGFHCFNLFTFTKMSFYKYIFGLSITYILVFKNVNK